MPNAKTIPTAFTVLAYCEDQDQTLILPRNGTSEEEVKEQTNRWLSKHKRLYGFVVVWVADKKLLERELRLVARRQSNLNTKHGKTK